MLTPVLFVLVSFLAADPAVDAARAHLDRHGADVIRAHADLLSIPNVTGHDADIRRNAEYIRRLLEDRGVDARLLEVENAAPIVYGRIESPGAARTLGVYVHYDGQPVDPAAWTNDPWTPTLYNAPISKGGERIPLPDPGDEIDPEWRLYARAASDDKAPITAIAAALDALRAHTIEPSVNLVFFFEGEEESGSAHLRDHLTAHRALLSDIDAWLICDGPVHQSRRPQLVFGVRGITTLDITVYGAAEPLHSGHYGNWAPNPAMMLSQLLASMKDRRGRVLINGFYDDTEPPGPAERAAVENQPRITQSLMQDLGLARTEVAGQSYLETLLRPSLNVRGFVSATVGDTARNVIPTEATASIDIRLAKGDDPVKMLDRVEAHIRKQGYHIVREDPDHAMRLAHPRIARVDRHVGYPAVRTPIDDPALEPVIQAARRAAGRELLLTPTLGGSLPLYLFEELHGAPLVIVPIANHDNRQHGPDENIRIANLWYGVELFAALFTMNED